MSLELLREEGLRWVEANRSKRFSGVTKLLTDLYPDNAHFIYELLQNAEDARDKSVQNSSGALTVRFTLSDDDLEFEHNGDGLFTLEDVGRITGIGDSAKLDDPTSIGKFGIGFKAVFAYTNSPEIHSGEFHFRIHDLVVPETCGVPQPIMNAQETRFKFPFNNPKKQPEQAVAEIEQGLRALGENTLLFLSHIRQVEYLLPDGSFGSLERIDHEGGHIEIHARHPDGTDTVTHWLRFHKDVQVTDEDGQTKICRIAIVYSLVEEGDKKRRSDWKVVPLDHGQVSIYFPAEKETSNLRFHIHAPFASTVARDSVRDCQANSQLRDRIAELVVESFAAIRDKGMLTTGFLAVLPNETDNLPPFYEPIRKVVVHAFKSQALTPTKSGTHAKTTGLYRGPAIISEVLSDDDLSILTNYNPPLWAANPPLQTREYRFLDSLKIDSWGWSELSSSLNSLSGENRSRIENWIAQKDDAWLMRFYALLGEARIQHHTYFSVDNLCIVRVETEHGTDHKTSKDAFFPPDDESSPLANLHFVKPAVYAKGRSESQKNDAKTFLTYIGVRPYDAKAEVELILKGYSDRQEISRKKNISHIRQFVALWSGNQTNIEIFKDVPFLCGEETEGRYCKAADLYLDAPYTETGLEALFNDNSLLIERPKWRISVSYNVVKKFTEFAAALGVMQQLEICDHIATKMQQRFFNETGKSIIDEDFFVNGLQWHKKSSSKFIGIFSLKECKSLALSRVIWTTMSRAEPKILEAHYQKWNQGRKSKSSFLVEYLALNPWVPDKDENFQRPCEITKETLHSDFIYDDRNGWLTAIQFGANSRKQSEDYQRANYVVQRIGFSSADVAVEIAKIMKEAEITPSDLRSMVSSRQRALQPVEAVRDPDRRRRGVLEGREDAPDKESVKKERTIQQGLSREVGEAKAYLRAKYTNVDGQLLCQCCHSEPFKIKEFHYFEAVQCISGLTRHYDVNRLALCPNCAAMYQHGKETDNDKIRRRIIEHPADDTAPAVEIPVRLAGRDFSLRFVGTHWFDLKTILAG